MGEHVEVVVVVGDQARVVRHDRPELPVTVEDPWREDGCESGRHGRDPQDGSGEGGGRAPAAKRVAERVERRENEEEEERDAEHGRSPKHQAEEQEPPRGPLVAELDSPHVVRNAGDEAERIEGCLLYTSEAADDPTCVELGGSRTIKKKRRRKDRHHWT